MEIFFLWIVFSVLVGVWANSLGRSVGWAIVGSLLLSPVIVGLYYLIVGSASKCPHCKGSIPKDVVACKHCGRDIIREV